jgi:dTDP-4-amino-4,6-dideoxygalactose transaminase
MKVPFAVPELGNEEIEEITKAIKSGWLTSASCCSQFEENFAEFIGTKHALTVNSATAALHLGLEALEIIKGDKVLVPTFTFTATAEVVRYMGADPIFVDCDARSFCISVNQIEKSLKRYNFNNENRLKAIIPVHFGGHPCDMDTIIQFSKKK